MRTDQQTLNQRLASNLSQLMAERKLSAVSLGRLANVSPNTISNYLRATAVNVDFTAARGRERSARLTEIDQIAEALRVDPIVLLRPSDRQAESRDVVLGREDRALLEAADALDAEGRALLTMLALALAKRSGFAGPAELSSK